MKIDSLKSADKLSISSYGLKILILSDETRLIEKISEDLLKTLPNNVEEYTGNSYDFRFYIKRLLNGLFVVYKNNELIPAEEKKEELLVDFFLSQLRLTVGEFAVNKVFVHSGVVAWKGRGILLPADSYAGKTTLVSELVKKGADYYSDEFAVLDERGYVHPFPKMLSVRGIIAHNVQKDVSVESFGGVSGRKSVPVGLVLFTEYLETAVWSPETLSLGQGMLEIIPHTLPIRYKPNFSLNVLNKTLNRAIITKSLRGEASNVVSFILKLIEK